MRRSLFITSLALLVCVSGCVNTSTSGTTTTAAFAGWVPFAWLVVCLGLIIVGIKMHRDKHSKGIGYVIAGAILLIGAAPASLSDKVVISDDGVKINNSFFWFAPQKHDFQFSDLKVIRFEEREKKSGRDAGKTEAFAVFVSKSGTSTDVKVERLVKATKQQLIDAARRKGVTIEGG